MSRAEITEPTVTDNARVVLGWIARLIGKEGSFAAVVEVDAAAAAMFVRTKAGNVHRVRVDQIEGVE